MSRKKQRRLISMKLLKKWTNNRRSIMELISRYLDKHGVIHPKEKNTNWGCKHTTHGFGLAPENKRRIPFWAHFLGFSTPGIDNLLVNRRSR